MEITYSNLQAENDMLRMDVGGVKNDIQELLAHSNQTLFELQETLQGNQRTVAQVERDQLHELDQIVGDHDDFIKSLVKIEILVVFLFFSQKKKYLLLQILSEIFLSNLEWFEKLTLLNYSLSYFQVRDWSLRYNQIEDKYR